LERTGKREKENKQKEQKIHTFEPDYFIKSFHIA
jgi:hypothetical protein